MWRCLGSNVRPTNPDPTLIRSHDKSRTALRPAARRRKKPSPSNASLFYALTKLSVGDRSIVGYDVFLCTGSHDIHSPGFELATQPNAIGCYVWIVAGATILPGVNIGDGAVAGAMAVVSRNVRAGARVGGNSARMGKSGREIPRDFDPLALASIDWRQSVRRLKAALRRQQRTGAN